MPENATFITEINLGEAESSEYRQAVQVVEINVGEAESSEYRQAAQVVEINVGIERPTGEQLNERPQVGWGACLTAKVNTVFIPGDANANAIVELEVT
jgi:hypothetical protein